MKNILFVVFTFFMGLQLMAQNCPVLKYRYKKEIVIMEERSNYVKRTQRDYSMSFKLSVVNNSSLKTGLNI